MIARQSRLGGLSRNNALRAAAVIVGLLAPARAPGAYQDLCRTREDPFRGSIRAVITGASMAQSAGPNGLLCLEPSATATVRAEDVPVRATLKKAILFIAGSLFDDGTDFTDPPEGYGVELFSTYPLDATNSDHHEQLSLLARGAADKQVSFRPPGASGPLNVPNGPPTHSSYVTIDYIPGPGEDAPLVYNEEGNFAFFMRSIDVTDAINVQGGGILPGEYEVSGLTADICRGEEAQCTDDPNGPTCETTGFPHSKAVAAFALLLIVEDPSLPRHVVTVFECMEQIFGDARTLGSSGVLELGSPISSPASGSLAFFALEGDAVVGIPDASRPCGAEEYLRVVTLTPSTDPDSGYDEAGPGYCAVDDDNPVGNLFNSTLNVQPCDPTLGTCCGTGNGLCDVTGVDIDRFDIATALVPGEDKLGVEVGTVGDRVGLAAVVVGVDVFEPVLSEDSQIRALDSFIHDRQYIRLGGTTELSIAVSNTGGITAKGVSVRMDAPGRIEDLTILRVPTGADDASTIPGGANGTGRINVGVFDVPAGEVRDVRVRFVTTCDGLGASLTSTATLAANDVPTPVEIAMPELVPAGPGVGACAGMDPEGPFLEALPPRKLRGGGGCAQSRGSGSPLAAGALLLLLLLRHRLGRHRRRRRGGALAATAPLALAPLLAAAAAAGPACALRHEHETAPKTPRAITELEGLPGTTCGSPLRVVVDNEDGTRFCIDRFEATLDAGALGQAHQGTDDADPDPDGSTLAKAVVELAADPTTGISWYQAKAACANADLRLCTAAEWERACRGPGPTPRFYPYGDDFDDSACNGFFNYAEVSPLPTGSLASCGSPDGVYDLSGNVEEWVETPTERIPGDGTQNDRGVRGGSYRSNAAALFCAGLATHAPPGSTAPTRGFRCCSDF